ncbi:PREDICTED: E3 ubiquitin-protein ligase UPL4 isoform X2 [Nelumbo nucifera]|uniref:HECT-type E3 ubiquitin transferase n=1 Tax=Nelumbo nucifera TaxID=4432 RepID=A0A1U7ZNY1_NELNU|nr:PREDICTED: E3 ubiquitin-protein ligase UPL4 isoform X2 [Nelumbo nucifera]
MESRGRKRAELVDQLPADKRACSSSDFKPGSSSSSVQTQMASTNSASEAPDCEMETSSSASVSGRSEGEAEKDSAYGSCDSDGLDDPEQRHRSFREYHPRRSSSDQAKFKRILSSLADDAGPSSQVVALTELCDVLSFCTDDSLSSFTADSFAPILVNLAKNESNPDIMLLAVRAITYLCDVLPRSSGFLVRHDAVPALCARLMAIEYMDLAEQCLQALEKISRDHPLACSQAGAIMAVLNYIDFFSTSVQRVALSTVANICKKLPSDCSSSFMEAVPILCNLLRYEDRKLVESVAICLIRIVERVGHSSDMLDELCKHGVIHQVSHLVALNSRTTLSQPIYIGLIGLLARLASGSVLAVRTLIELNISSTLKQILATYELSHGMPHPHIGDMHSSQVHEVIKLLNVLLPPLPRNNEDIPLVSDKERILVDQPELLQQFRIDILPVLIQVVNSGANSYVCYGSLSVINKLVYFSRSDMLLDLLKNTNISSFLAGVFARKDHHILISALKIAKTVLEKLPDACFSSFVKEGVVYSIDALLMPERSPEIMFPTSTDIELSSGSNQKLAARDDPRCLCYALDSDQFPSSSEKGNCKLERNSVYTLAKKIKATYFATESHDSKIGMTETLQKLRTICTLLIDKENQGNMSPPIKRAVDMIEGNPTTSHLVHTEPGSRIQDLQYSPEMDSDLKLVDSSNASASTSTSSGKECMEGRKCPTSCGNSDDPTKLVFHLEGRKLDRALTLYQEILNQHVKAENDMIVGPKFWNQVYKITYRKATDLEKCDSQDSCHGSSISSALNKLGTCWKDVPFLSGMLVSKLPCDLEKSNPTYDMLVLLKSLEGLNRSAFHLMSHERRCAFAEGRSNNFDDLRVNVPSLPQSEFVSCKLTEKLEQQMRDPLAVSVGGMPSWCAQLMAACPFLFGFESKCRYFQLKAFGSSRVQPHPWPQSATSNSNTSNDRQQHAVLLPRKKFQVRRSHILDSAAQMMDLYANHKAILEVEYSEEVGTGLGPTMEFYTLVSHEFQKAGLGMWREDHSTPTAGKGLDDNSSGFVAAHLGLFPRPWSPSLSADKTLVSEVIKKFVLLGKIVAKALQDGRVLDLPFSKAFYKLILEKELCIYDIQSFEPEFGRTLLEFQALVDRKKNLNSISEKGTNFISDSCFRDTRIEDLCLEFTLPGYPDYVLGSEPGNKIVNMDNLEEYVSLTVDATVNSGIIRQVEAFKSGFNQVFPIKSLQIFSEEELERLLCGERDAWASNEIVDHVKFDHGYTSSSPPVINLLEIIQEFEHDQRRAFLQFVTGAPRLPPGGLAALNPKLTIVRKHCSEWVDGDLPSVMTCANYLKLPPYSSKERMRERILYAITEGQGSFHLS